ncbi:hypothetical protein J2Z60_000151 [Lactobacillus colini]|uniref:DUF2750 domain-containing protein n=1 Tax=Lactobacillus colini TaxID=1819254 RepID=A0ABS4MC68_9LACO|nr:hypothetical protein [Lactobacillus colini]MBP2056989.1 hypothetical protein [Lactobacillus colini]
MTIEELKLALHEYNPNFTLKGFTKDKYILRYKSEKILKISWDAELDWSVQFLMHPCDWYPIANWAPAPILDMVDLSEALRLISKLDLR